MEANNRQPSKQMRFKPSDKLFDLNSTVFFFTADVNRKETASDGPVGLGKVVDEVDNLLQLFGVRH